MLMNIKDIFWRLDLFCQPEIFLISMLISYYLNIIHLLNWNIKTKLIVVYKIKYEKFANTYFYESVISFQVGIILGLIAAIERNFLSLSSFYHFHF